MLDDHVETKRWSQFELQQIPIDLVEEMRASDKWKRYHVSSTDWKHTSVIML